MSKPTILVTSATSRNGSEAAKRLLDKGKYTVRLGARSPSKLASLATRGAESVTLDNTLESAISAFTGVSAAYIILPAMVGGAEVTLFHNYLQAAKQTNTKHIVYLSGQVAGLRDVKPSKVHNHGEHEQLLKETGISYTILRPTWFHENITSYHAKSIKSTGQFKTSAGAGVWTSIAIADIAAVAVAALTEPVKHANKVYALQEEEITDDLLAEKISKAIGKKVTHVNLTPEEHKELIKRTYPGTAAQVEEFADAILAFDTFKRNSTFSHVGPDLGQVLGRKGITVDEFLAQHAQVFL